MPRSSAKSPWRQKRDPLWRGDTRGALATVDPGADPSVVRHVLYLEGAGRATPYHSTSEERSVAGYFAGASGQIYQTTVAVAAGNGVDHISRMALIDMLQGTGKGNAHWPNAFEVMQARKYVEQWSEHLLSYADMTSETLANDAAKKTFR